MVRAAFCRPLSINNTHTPHGAKRPRLSLWESWQPERADLSARRRYASEQPPQAALSESQRGCRPYFCSTPPQPRAPYLGEKQL